MAIYNEILSGRFARMLQRIFSMKGEQAMKQLSGELMPVFPFFTGVENRYLEGWQRYAIGFSLGAVAAQNAKIRLRNSARSVIAVIEKIVISNTAAGAGAFTVRIAGAVTTDLANVGSNSNLQLDLRGPANPSLVISSENSAGVQSGTLVYIGNIAVNVNQDIILTDDQELVLVNGNVGGAVLNITCESANQGFQCAVVWRERPLEESEQGP